MPKGAFVRTPEMRAKISASLTGRSNPHVGVPQSDVARAKVSAAQKGHITSPETRAKISATLTGHKASPETCARLCVAHANPSPETRAKTSATLMGRIMSPETRAKISIGNWRGGQGVSWRKSRAKRRLLGWNLLNSWFPNSDGHHINKEDVIYIPSTLHDSVKHNVWTGKNMDKINALAGQYLTEDWT